MTNEDLREEIELLTKAGGGMFDRCIRLKTKVNVEA
jgi:hypothetical protein